MRIYSVNRINYAITVDDDYKELLLCLRNRKLEK